MEDGYKTIVRLLIIRAITGSEAELYIKMIDSGYNIHYEVNDHGGNEVDVGIQFSKQYTRTKIKSKQKGFL